MWMRAGQVVGLTALDLLTDPALLQAAQAEFRKRTGVGMGGSEWVVPLLPRDVATTVQDRSPEYVTTVRGEGWTMPVDR